MTPPRSDNRLWVRKTDGDMHVVGASEQPQRRWYPGTIDDLLDIVTNEMKKGPPTNPQAHICGSHWAMSKAAVTAGQMIESSTPVHETGSDQTAPRLNHVLYNVIPDCMTAQAKRAFLNQGVTTFNATVAPAFWPAPMKFYLFHVESGMRIYELYSLIDSGVDGADSRSLSTVMAKAPGSTVDYTGPWALETMGGAGGQTIAGVASTATHGGDVQASSISDLVVAIHLIAPDGQEYWIEKHQILPTQEPFPLVDEHLLNTKAYPQGELRRRPIQVLRSDDLMHAAIVSCGRMGIIYSMVVRAVRQFALDEQIDSSQYWSDVKTWLTNPSDPKRIAMLAHRFARIDVDVYPKPVFDWHTVALAFGAGLLGGLPLALVGLYAGLKGDKYRCWIYTRTAVPLQASNLAKPTAQPEYFGRAERAGSNQGATAELEGQQDPPGHFRDPCSSANWLRQFLQDTKNILSGIRNDALIAYGLLEVAADAAAFLGNEPLALFLRSQQAVSGRVALFAEAWIVAFSAIQDALPDDMPFGDFICALINTFSELHAAALIQLMYWAGANSQHTALKHPAISYAVMDRHSYVNKGCIAPGDSIEFFVDATTPGLITFIDYVLDEVRDLANNGKGFGGYISLRFMTSTPAFLAMERWSSTCSIEIAGLSKANGTATLMDHIDAESLKRDIIVHWGQRHTRSQKDLEKLYAPTVGGPFHKWRKALSQLSANGRLDNFSTLFTKFRGLEITEPLLYGLRASMTEGCDTETTTIDYDALDNPPETHVWLTQRFDNGTVKDLLPGGTASKGSVAVAIGRGRSQVRLSALRELNGKKYESAVRTVDLHGFQTGDEWHFEFIAQNQMIDGVPRWVVEINLFSQYISDSMRVASIKLVPSSSAAWIVRNAELSADVPVDPTVQVAQLSPHPIMNKRWLFFTKLAATGSPPQVDLFFRMEC